MRIRFHHRAPREHGPSRSGPGLAHAGSDRLHDRQKQDEATFVSDASSTGHRTPVRRTRRRQSLPAGLDLSSGIAVNLLGAAGAALFARASVLFYLHTHRLIGGLFVLQQAWFVVAFLAPRPQRAAGGRLTSWRVSLGERSPSFVPAGRRPPA